MRLRTRMTLMRMKRRSNVLLLSRLLSVAVAVDVDVARGRAEAARGLAVAPRGQLVAEAEMASHKVHRKRAGTSGAVAEKPGGAEGAGRDCLQRTHF